MTQKIMIAGFLSSLLQQYAEPHRHYHNFAHVTRMLKDSETIPFFRDTLSLYEKNNLYLAILYHDAIYNIGKDLPESNEVASAKFFKLQNLFHGLASKQDEELIVNAIHDTEFHFKEGYVPSSNLGAMLMDLDLLSFTDDFDKFKDCNCNIQTEYCANGNFTEEEVCEGRKQFILNLYKNKLLKYHILPNAEELENKAYFNLYMYINYMGYK